MACIPGDAAVEEDRRNTKSPSYILASTRLDQTFLHSISRDSQPSLISSCLSPISPVQSTRNLYAEWARQISSLPDGHCSPGEEMMMMGVNTTDADEFESLPPALRRKYFSTLERLRLAQDSNLPWANTNSSHNRRLRGTVRLKSPTANNNNADRGFASSCNRTPTRRLQKFKSSRDPPGELVASPEEIQWFNSLPEKIQRRHFTREERLYLAGQRDKIILDAADEVFYRLGHQANRSDSTLFSRSKTRSSSPSNVRPATSHHDHHSTQHADSAIEMDSLALDNFRWLDDEDDIDLSLDDYHAHVAETATPDPKSFARKPSFRRALSFTGIPLGRHSLSLTGNKAPSRSQSAATQHTIPKAIHQRSNSSRPPSNAGVRVHTRAASVSTIDPSAQYYQDPEARLKLRVYLASPQKFDEAIEFGFPSLNNKENEHDHRPTTRSKKVDDSNRTFFQDDSVSIYDEGPSHQRHGTWSGDRREYPIRQSQEKPRRHTTSRTSKDNDSRALRPRTVPANVQPYVKSSATNREMTLKMTLTRPDLRATDEGLLSPASEDDPLRLADLPEPVESANIWDTIPEDQGMMKKMWRKIRMK